MLEINKYLNLITNAVIFKIIIDMLFKEEVSHKMHHLEHQIKIKNYNNNNNNQVDLKQHMSNHLLSIYLNL